MSRSFVPLTLRRLGVIVGTLSACLVALAAISPPPAFAVMVGCRTDPIIEMVGGKVLRVTIQLEAPASNIHSIRYVLHLAPSERVMRVIYTGGELKDKENLRVVYDGEPDTYLVETFVSGVSEFDLTVTSSLRRDRVSVDGSSNEVVTVLLQP